jgi:hypothetical protein
VCNTKEVHSISLEEDIPGTGDFHHLKKHFPMFFQTKEGDKMNRRLYFLIPDRIHALQVVDDLVRQGVDAKQMHAIGNRRTRLDGLPDSSMRQRSDSASRVEKILWNGNLLSFGLSFIATVLLPVLMGATWWILAPIAIMMGNLLIGIHFSNKPNTHLGEFRDALAHGEILLMVDVPESQVARVEREVHSHHPEATVGGVGWSTQAFGL